MVFTSFLKNILFSIVSSCVLFFALSLALPILPYLDFFIISSLFFIIYNLALFYFSSRAKKSKVKKQFIHLVLYNVFVKIIFAFLVVFIYFKTTEPEDKYFMVPFLICYVIFTIFETYFMSKEARF